MEERLINEWIERLGLGGWDITVQQNCLPSDFVSENADGEVEYQETLRVATIRILAQSCYGDGTRPFDPEQILAHELLHLKFCFLDESGNDLQDRLLHRLIEDMSKALVSAKRAASEPSKEVAS